MNWKVKKLEGNLEVDRRGFMRSIFGLGLSTSATASASEASAATKGKSAFFWCDLKNGNVGFPTGFNVPVERPGSLVKVVAMAALIDEGNFNTNQEHECTGTYKVPGSGNRAGLTVHCQYVHGRIDIVRALAVSCNCFFAQATQRLTTRAFLDKARALGLASPVAGKPPGQFPADAQAGSSLPYVLGLAEDFKPSCLQLMRLAALIGVGPLGQLPVLHSAENLELVDKEKNLKVALTERSHELITRGMRLCATEGTAKKLDPKDKLHVAAKTGTTPHGAKFQSHIIGFFPYDKPRNAFCLFAPAGTSQDSAVPSAREILLSTTW